jgi:methylmalonyl-CoA carboxyltransferase 12S subunit
MALLLIQGDATMWMLVVLLMVGWAATYIATRRMLNREIAALRREMDERVNALLLSIRSAQRSEVGKAAAAPPAAKPEAAAVSQTPSQPSEKHQGISPEVLLVIAAAVTAFLGKKVRIRSAKMLQTPYEIVNPWVQQGRVVVQASHNLSPHGY